MSNKFAGLAVATDRPARMTILHPVTGQPIRRTDSGEAAWIDILSADSKAARDHEREMQNRRLRSRARRVTAEEIEAEGIELLVALTKGWSLATLEGEPLDVPFTAEAARELYSSPDLAFIRRQVNEFAADLGNFPARTTSLT
jgi:acyl-CoA reductase-like NAD-dependent aldehyde dehydrogenase